MIPDAFLLIHELPQCTHALFLGSCWIHHSSLQLPEAPKCFPVPLVQGIAASIGTSDFFLHVDGFFIFTIFRIVELNASQPSSIMELWLSFAHSYFSFF